MISLRSIEIDGVDSMQSVLSHPCAAIEGESNVNRA